MIFDRAIDSTEIELTYKWEAPEDGRTGTPGWTRPEFFAGRDESVGRDKGAEAWVRYNAEDRRAPSRYAGGRSRWEFLRADVTKEAEIAQAVSVFVDIHQCPNCAGVVPNEREESIERNGDTYCDIDCLNEELHDA